MSVWPTGESPANEGVAGWATACLGLPTGFVCRRLPRRGNLWIKYHHPCLGRGFLGVPASAGPDGCWLDRLVIFKPQKTGRKGIWEFREKKIKGAKANEPDHPFREWSIFCNGNRGSRTANKKSPGSSAEASSPKPSANARLVAGWGGGEWWGG